MSSNEEQPASPSRATTSGIADSVKVSLIFSCNRTHIEPVFGGNVEHISKFKETKKELLSQHELYLKQHPEISQLSSDYLKMLLQRKPDDVYQFTRDYFAMFLSEEQLREVHKNAANEDQPKATESIAEQQQRKEDVREDEGGASKRVKLEEDAVAQSADPVETPAAAASPTAESSSSAAVVVEDATSTNEDVTPVAELVDAGVAAEVTDVATDEPVASDVPVEVANDIIAEALATPATDVTSADTTSEPPKTEAQEESQ